VFKVSNFSFIYLFIYFGDEPSKTIASSQEGFCSPQMQEIRYLGNLHQRERGKPK